MAVYFPANFDVSNSDDNTNTQKHWSSRERPWMPFHLQTVRRPFRTAPGDFSITVVAALGSPKIVLDRPIV